MKRILYILFIGLYISISIGVVSYIQICHHKIVDISIISKPKHIDSLVKIEKHSYCETSEESINTKDCCSEQTLFIQFVKHEQIPESHIYKANLLLNNVIILSYTSPNQTIDLVTNTNIFPDHPPKIINRHILYCNLLYYS